MTTQALQDINLLQSDKDASILDAGSQKITELRNALLDPVGGLYLFCLMIFQYRDLKPEIHGPICNLIGQWEREQDGAKCDYDTIDKLIIQVPREFFKTSVVTRANSLWQVARGFYQDERDDEAVVIFNERLENTAKWIRSIRDVVSGSKEFHVLFRDLLPPGVAFDDSRGRPNSWKWSDAELMFQRNGRGYPESSITGMGITAASAGGHWPTIIKDDIISIEASRSPTVMQYSKDWFDTSVYLERPALKGRDLIVCTPWTYDDVYSFAVKKYDYKLYRRSALEDGQSIFPEKLTTAELKTQQERDPYNFSAQMQCRPMPGRETSFDVRWLGHGGVEHERDLFVISPDSYSETVGRYDAETIPPRTVPLSYMRKILLFDPAPSEKAEISAEPLANNGLLMEGMDSWERRFLLEAWADRDDPLEILAQIYKMCRFWGCNTVAIEEENFSKLYRPLLRMYGKLYGKKLELRFIKLSTKKQHKDVRITSMIPKARQRIYYLNDGMCDKFEAEYIEYPFSRTRDLMDCWAYDYCLKRPSSEEEDIAWRSKRLKRTKGRSDITGYGESFIREESRR